LDREVTGNFVFFIEKRNNLPFQHESCLPFLP
jgi:hypothetical protein